MMLLDKFPSLKKKQKKKDAAKDKDSEQRNCILCQARRTYIGKKMKKGWLILNEKMF